MNISKIKKPIKTADGYRVKAGDTLYVLTDDLGDYKIYSFTCKYWHTGSIIEDRELYGYRSNLSNEPWGFYPESHSRSPLNYFPKNAVYKKYENAVKAFFNHVKKLSRKKFDINQCRHITTVEEMYNAD